MNESVFVGLDIGASRTKVAVIDAKGTLLGHAVKKSGTDFSATAAVCLELSLEMAGASRSNVARAVSTGYGRANVPFVTETNKTEIGCLAKGCSHYFSGELSIIDIGGQDNKIVKLDSTGKRSSFKMNRKCAAGTGAFLEEMAGRLDLPLEEMNDLARQSEDMVKLGSFCTVFSGTEVLESIRHGKRVTDIVKGIFYSVLKRVMEMDSLTDRVVMTGGVVAHNPYIVQMAEEMLGRPVMLPQFPQLAGAIGAALYAWRGTILQTNSLPRYFLLPKGEGGRRPDEGDFHSL
ncbi:acyl-CoA dehydratase activase, partial [Geotalea toluenoxydans]|uniref:acyl-CoA dehydratase activase n=1 Tax=Geotalea toluenoxydans TaxID=421624 RepID=UPI000AAED203